MNERLEYQQLECYKLANDMQKEKLNREPSVSYTHLTLPTICSV